MAERKIVSMKRKFRFTFSFLVLLAVIFYVAVLGWNYLTKEHISIYEVNTAEISDDPPLYGFILRTEEVISAGEDGYVNYYHAEGTRIAAGKVAYTIDQNDEVTEILSNLQTGKENQENISAVRDAISSFQNSFSMSDYQQVSNFSSSVTSVLFEQNEESLFDSVSKQMQQNGNSKNYVKGKTKKSGVISYSIDGYEKTKQKDITTRLFDQYAGITQTALQKKKKISSGDPVYKLITDNEWSLIVLLNDTYYEELKDKDYVRVTVDKDNMSFNAGVTLFDQDGSHFARLTTNRYMEHYINDRFLKIEFDLKSASGLKIPNSSILNKDCYVLPADVITSNQNSKGVLKQTVNESGGTANIFTTLDNMVTLNDKYYIRSGSITGGDILLTADGNDTYIVSTKESLPGVYCVNQGYCQFRPIEIIYQNKEYTIVSENTSGGLAAYDHIVVDPSNLKDDDFIE